MSHPVIIGAQGPPYQDVRAALLGHPFTLTHGSGPHPYHVMGRDRYKGIWVHLHSAAHARTFIREIDGHLLAPPPWRAPFPPYPDAPPWLAGYMQAKKLCLPFRGPFRSVDDLTRSDFLVPYSAADARAAFYAGARHYTDTVRNISHDLQLRAAEDDTDRTHPGTHAAPGAAHAV